MTTPSAFAPSSILTRSRRQRNVRSTSRPHPFPCRPPRMVAAEGVGTKQQRAGRNVVLEKRQIGHGGLVMTEAILGTMTWGHQNSTDDAHAQLDYAYDRGVIGIDAAELYPTPPAKETCGDTERMIGSWLEARGGASFRDKLVLCSKVAGGTASGRAIPWIRGADRRVDRINIRTAVDGILARLGTDYIDLLQIHWPDRYVPMFGAGAYDIEKDKGGVSVEEQVAAMDELIREGKIRNYGLSNETAWGVSQFYATARAGGYARPASVQNSYSLVHRDFENHLAEVCAPSNADISLLAFSPLAGGALCGKYLPLTPPRNARFAVYPSYMKRFQSTLVGQAVGEYKRIADAAGLSLTALALAWCKSRWFVRGTIIGATSVEQLRENLDSFAVRLDDDVVCAVEQVYARYRDPSMTS